MSKVLTDSPLARLAADVALWTGVGVVMALLGPFGTIELPTAERFEYWLICMVGGGLIGVAIDAPVHRSVRHFWLRLAIVSVLMTPLVTVLVGFAAQLVVGEPLRPRHLFLPGFQVFVVSAAAMLFRQLAWARADETPEPAPPGDVPPADPLGAFRQRLSAKRRAAALIAVEAEDHYLRVHTDAGDELITARFVDAIAELAGAAGFQTHRSWWVAADAIEDVTWKRGRGEARLKGGLVVPISRSNAAPLKAAGWF